MKMCSVLIAAVALACGGGGGPTSPNSPSIAGTYLINASTVTNTCGPGLDQELLVEIDDHSIQIRRDGNNYTIGFDVFIPATVSGNNLHATQVLTFARASMVRSTSIPRPREATAVVSVSWYTENATSHWSPWDPLVVPNMVPALAGAQWR
jgi:hypothetical protein